MLAHDIMVSITSGGVWPENIRGLKAWGLLLVVGLGTMPTAACMAQSPQLKTHSNGLTMQTLARAQHEAG